MAFMPESFNGAATFPSRKFLIDVANTRGEYTLQWGRDVSVAEVREDATVTARPNMLQWGRDVSVAEVLPRRDSPAECALQWGRDVSVAEVSVVRSDERF